MVKLSMIGVLISFAGIMVAVFGGKPLLTLLYNSEYANFDYLFITLMAVAGLSYVSMFLSYGLVAIRKFKINLAIQVFAMVLCIVTCILLTNQYRLMGAAIGIGLGYIVVNIATIYVLASYSLKSKGSGVIPNNSC
jgi:O-antigen/teichoic acid export membrane protein